jgi:hypothetical protein
MGLKISKMVIGVARRGWLDMFWIIKLRQVVGDRNKFISLLIHYDPN